MAHLRFLAMTDAVSIYLEEHSIVNLLDGLANKLAASLPADGAGSPPARAARDAGR